MARIDFQSYEYQVACTKEEYRQNVRESVRVPVHAYAGDVRYFKGLIGKSIRRALGIRKWNSAPHNVTYYSTARAADNGFDTPFFEADLTLNEVGELMSALKEDIGVRGWGLVADGFEPGMY